jgi:hypothetical protein
VDTEEFDWGETLDEGGAIVAWEGVLMDEVSDVNVRMTEDNSDVVVGVN